MDDTIKQRMKWVITERLKRDPAEVSMCAGCDRGYLWATWNPKRRVGSLNKYKLIADNEGINALWLFDGVGSPLKGEPKEGQIEREYVLIALQAIFEHYCHLDKIAARDAALAVLDVVEHPPNGTSETDRLRSVHSAILGQLRVYDLR